MQKVQVRDKFYKLLDDIPSEVRLGQLSGLFEGNELDSCQLLLALPRGENVPAEQDSAHFYCEEDVLHLQLERGARLTSGSRNISAKTTSMLQTWVNADPENHARLPLFRAVQAVGKAELACLSLVNADVPKRRPGKRFDWRLGLYICINIVKPAVCACVRKCTMYAFVPWAAISNWSFSLE